MPKPTKIVSIKKVRLTFAAILILAFFAALINWPKLPAEFPGQAFFNKFTPKLGLDLQGGTHLIYQADISQISEKDKDSALEGVREVIERRINAYGVSEPLVQTGSNNRLIIELAGVHDINEAIKLIGETPLLEFKEQDPNAGKVELTEEEKQAAKQYNEEALNKTKDIIAQLNSGADFSELAKQYSEDPSVQENSGDLDFAKEGSFVPEFEKAIFEDLQDGEITQEPVKTQFGYHIIKKIEERGEGEEREVHAAHILIITKNEQYNEQASLNDQWLNTALSGKYLRKATVEFDQNTGQPHVSLEFDSEGKDLFAQITKKNVGKPVAIFLDEQPISIPTVQEEITQGKAVITGSFNLKEAKLLAQRLNAGALPVPITLINQQTVGPSLGKISLAKSLVAGFLGLLLVALFMIFYYRFPGVLAVFALVIYGLITLAIFELWPITLTLAGIAGFILSIGMAVDANVLIFERMKEEIRNGKPMAMSIEDGFNRAWLSIRDSNVSSLITCLILTWFSSSSVKGFAITLGIGILVSMFSAITITRTFLRLFSGKFFEKHTFLLGVKKTDEEPLNKTTEANLN
ncbi:protein translocase subunit SecD [Patescibacteria group bacterium]|nr:protein translocase subunit SecD [Patescibacteria group bacterium]